MIGIELAEGKEKEFVHDMNKVAAGTLLVDESGELAMKTDEDDYPIVYLSGPDAGVLVPEVDIDEQEEFFMFEGNNELKQ